MEGKLQQWKYGYYTIDNTNEKIYVDLYDCRNGYVDQKEFNSLDQANAYVQTIK